MYITEKDAIISHAVLGKFVSFDGGGSTIGFDGVRDKPNGDVIHFQQPTERDNITLKRFYDPMVDDAFIARHDKGDPMEAATTVQPLDPDLKIVIPGHLKTYVGCKVTKVTPPKFDANSTSPSEITYELVYQKLA